jgi:hypothetical protein
MAQARLARDVFPVTLLSVVEVRADCIYCYGGWGKAALRGRPLRTQLISFDHG